MKLRNIRIQNFRAIEDLTLSFLDDFGDIRPMTVLAGPNGCGKTSVLFALVQALRGVVGYNTAYVPAPSDSDIRRAGRADAYHGSPPPTIRVELELEFDACEQEAIPKLIRETEGVDLPPLPEGRLSVIWVYPPPRLPDGKLRPSWFLEDSVPRGHRVLDWLKARTVAIRAWRDRKIRYELLDSVGGLCLFPQDRDLRERVVGEPASAGLPREETLSADANEEAPRPARERPVADILKYFSEYARGRRDEELPEERNWEKRIQTVFNKICAPKEYAGVLYRGDDPQGVPCFQDGEHRYPLHIAALGEQVVIDYLARLTYPSPLTHSLILIDEPEVHLHPAWIRQLYLALPQMGEGNQYIMTTHSLELRGLAAGDNALVDLGQLEGIKL